MLNLSFCFSSKVKYEAPQNISASWLKNNLSLTWVAAEKHPAEAEVWVRRDEHPTESWEKVRNICVCGFFYSNQQINIFAILNNHINLISGLLLQRSANTTNNTSICK